MPRKPKNLVSDLKIVEGAFVDDGDNPKAHITFFKSRDADPPDDGVKYEWKPATTSEILAARKFQLAFHEVRSAYLDSLQQIMWLPAGEMGSSLTKTTNEFIAETRALLGEYKAFPGLVAHGEKLVESLKSAAASEDGEAIKQAVEAFDVTDPKESTMPAPNTAPQTLDAILAALPEGQRKAVQDQLDAARRATEDAQKAATAAADAAVKAKDEAVAAQIKAATDSATKANEELAKLRDDNVTAAMKAKAQSIGVGDVEQIATLLKSAYGRDPKEGEMLEQNLRAMAAQAKKGMGPMLRAVGSDAPNGVMSTGKAKDDADAQLEVKARDLMKATPSLTFQRAYDQAAMENPDLAKIAFSSDDVPHVA